MANIYQIQQDLLSIFDSIEENEGELTPELEEQLSIKEDEFKDKIQAYAAVIKQLDLDLTGIKAEKCRLNDLQKSKEKTIERLKSVMATAIQMFGTTSKSGSKFIDYGTGKISIRHSDSIEVNEDSTKQFVNKFFSYFVWLNGTNQFDTVQLDPESIVNHCNVNNPLKDSDEIPTSFTEDDLNSIQADVALKLNLKDIISDPKAFAIVRSMLDYTTAISTKPSIDKAAIKKEYKSSGSVPTFSKYVIKDNIIIK